MPEATTLDAPAAAARRRRAVAGTVLALDFGERRTGVAVGDTVTRIAHPVDTIHADTRTARLEAVGRLIEAWKPALVVVGLPTHGDGSAHELAPRVERFARSVAGRFRVQVELVDEYLTTAAAHSELAGAGERRRAQFVDRLAAAGILATWFELASMETTA